ncbi:MAG: sec-independent protein translocase protein TatC [Planctomycetota bacterium]|jgi:sec-independent protein translocase protein TatC
MTSTDSDSKNLDEVEQSRMTLAEHLDELRRRLIYSAIAITVVFACAWAFKDKIVEIALSPFEDKARVWLNESLVEKYTERFEAGEYNREELEQIFFDGEMDVANLVDPVRSARSDDGSSTFFFYLKCTGYASFLIAGPFVLWQVWAFIAAGLYRNEKRAIYRYFPSSLALFFGGIWFGYTYLVPYAYFYLQNMGIEQIRQETNVTPYLKFLTSLGLGMGIVFQLPIIMMAVARVGLATPADFGKYRGHFIITAAVFAALITPPDPYTQLMMAVPMAILYEVGIWLSKLVVPKADSDSESNGVKAS